MIIVQNTHLSNEHIYVFLCQFRLLPTKSNRKVWALEKDIHTLILKGVKERTETGYEKNLLQMLLEGAQNSELSQNAIDQFIVDNCKNIYLAGYETTAVSATWTLMLLAANQEWQDRVRAEAIEVCNGQPPDADAVSKMKQVNKTPQYQETEV